MSGRERISPGSTYKYCNLLCGVHLEPLRTCLLEIIHLWRYRRSWSATHVLSHVSLRTCYLFSWSFLFWRFLYLHLPHSFLSSPVSPSLHIYVSPASGCSRADTRPVVWFCSRSSSMRRPAERQPASHQLQRWSDCFLFFFFLVCTSHWTNDALSPHAQFQRCGDLMCAFGQTPTVKWECFIRKPEIRGCKGSLQIFFCHEKDDKSEQGGLLSSILKYREPSSIHRLCHRSFTHLQLLTVSEVGHRSASDSVLGLDWWFLSAQFVKDTLDLFSLHGRHQCD